MTSIKPGATEIRHLRYFLAIAETGHFRRAASILHVSQPTLSHQIRQLELQMGATLFERSSPKVRLTAAGEALHRRAVTILRELADAQREIAELQALEGGQLRIGIVSTVNVAILPEAVSCFRKKHPKVSVSVRELGMENLEAELLAGRLDVGISFYADWSSERLEREPLFEDRLVAVLPSQHPLAKRRRLTLADILDQTLVLLAPGYCTRELVDENIKSLGLDQAVKPAIEMNSIEGVLTTVQQTNMITLLPNAAVQWKNYPDLRVKPLADEQEKLSSGLVGFLWVRGAHRTVAAKAFAQEVRMVVERAGCEVTK
jgi:LysR family cyn operon transcriptional activator